MSSDKASPLIADSKRNIKFYDPERVLDISANISKGFIIILSGGVPSEKALDEEGRLVKRQNGITDSDHICLGFLALTEGNVIDACFGVSTVTRRRSASPASKQVERTKGLLAAAADNNDDIRWLAVQTYRGGFEILLRHQERLSRLSCITRCFRYRSVVRKTLAAMERAFEEINDSVQAISRLET